VAIGWIIRPDAFINPIELTDQEETDCYRYRMVYGFMSKSQTMLSYTAPNRLGWRQNALRTLKRLMLLS
jgi:hypothetical protein